MQIWGREKAADEGAKAQRAGFVTHQSGPLRIGGYHETC